MELNEKKISSMAEGIASIALLPDPVGLVLESWIRSDGLLIRKVSVPFGVVGVIYESRPDVTSDAAALCFKSGNAVILRGGGECAASNAAIVSALREGLKEAGVPDGCIQYADDPDRTVVSRMLGARGEIDLLIPRGGAGLIRRVVLDAKVPFIETGTGNCHIYVHRDADFAQALDIVVNAKCQNPAVCNAAETVLVDSAIAAAFLPALAKRLVASRVLIKGCPKTREIVPGIVPAAEEDWETEFLDLVLAIKVVSGFEEAVAHISKYGTRHSESIVTQNREVGDAFQRTIDASCVYVNASTRLTDGSEFGFGAEPGISTQKLHARGPMGLRELTTYKYVIDGSGHLRE